MIDEVSEARLKKFLREATPEKRLEFTLVAAAAMIGMRALRKFNEASTRAKGSIALVEKES